MRRVLVDTSVFIDFFRGRPTGPLKHLLRNNAVLLSAYVRLELAQGVRREDAAHIGRLLAALPQIPHEARLFPAAEELLQTARGSGLNVGTVDLLLCAQARLCRASVLSSDVVFQKLAALGQVECIG
jgi:predicted nucleic acid-binding protein